MALTVGVNSYVDLIYAVDYAEQRDGNEAWIALTPEQQEKTLVSACDGLDTSFSYVGHATDPSQELAWPRDGVYYDPGVGNWVNLQNKTPSDIKKAQVEWAIDIGINGGFAGEDTGSGMTATPDSIGVGSINLSGLHDNGQGSSSGAYVVGKIAVPPIVMNYVEPYLGSNNQALQTGVNKPVWRAW